MAYELQYFLLQPVPPHAQVMRDLLAALNAQGWRADLANLSSSESWTAGDLEVGGQASGILIEVHSVDLSTEYSWQAALKRHDRPAGATPYGLGVVTLSGDVDDALVADARQHFVVALGAAEYDHVHGFTK